MHNKGNIANLKVINDAFEKDQLYDLFIGKLNKSYSPYSSVPTDPEYIFNSWVLFANEQSNQTKTWEVFKNIIIQISNDKDLGWFALYYLYSFLEFHKNHQVNVNDIQLSINKIISNGLKHRNHWINDYRWVGDKEYSFSIWDDFKRMLKNMSEDFEYNFHLSDVE